MKIIPGDLDDPGLRAMLREHLERARAETAPGSAHALDLDGLRAPDIDVFALWDDETPLAIGALKRLSADHGELKSMYTSPARRGAGLGGAMLLHLIAHARGRGLTRLSLETGSWDYFAPARAFYRQHGFVDCAPFAGYVDDPNSVLMTLDLAAPEGGRR